LNYTRSNTKYSKYQY